MNKSDVVSALQVSLKDIIDLFEESELEQAVDIASWETGWSLPVTKNFRCYWMLERAKRACISMMCFATAHKFKFKQINLNQRFDHYHAMLKEMDKQFAAAKQENPAEFLESVIADMALEDKLTALGYYIPFYGDYTPAGNFPAHRS